jgi:hypothetical protein
MNVLKEYSAELSGLESLGDLGNATSKMETKVSEHKPLNEEETALMALRVKFQLSKPAPVPKPNPDSTVKPKESTSNIVQESIEYLGEYNTLAAFNSNQSVRATAGDPKRSKGLNNLYRNMSSRVLDLSQRVKDTGITISRTAGGRYITATLPKETTTPGLSGAPTLGNVFTNKQVLDLVKEANLLLDITDKYGSTGVLTNPLTRDQYIDQILLTEPAKKEGEK